MSFHIADRCFPDPSTSTREQHTLKMYKYNITNSKAAWTIVSATCASEQTSSKGVAILWIIALAELEREKNPTAIKNPVFIPSVYSFMQCFQLHLSEREAFSYGCSHEHFAINHSSGSRTVKNESRKTQVTGGQAR